MASSERGTILSTHIAWLCRWLITIKRGREPLRDWVGCGRAPGASRQTGGRHAAGGYLVEARPGRLCDALCVKQRLDRGSCSVGVQAGTHNGLHDSPVEDDDQLIGQSLRVLGACSLGLAGEVAA